MKEPGDAINELESDGLDICKPENCCDCGMCDNCIARTKDFYEAAEK